MSELPLDLVLLSTPIGALGSGRGGGVELTLTSLILQTRITITSALRRALG